MIGDTLQLSGGFTPGRFIRIVCLLVSLLGFPFGKFPLPFFTFEEGLNIRPQTTGNGLDHVIRIRGLPVLRRFPQRTMGRSPGPAAELATESSAGSG